MLFEGDRSVGVGVQKREDGIETIRDKVIVDASGRKGLPGNQLGLKEQFSNLNKSAIWS